MGRTDRWTGCPLQATTRNSDAVLLQRKRRSKKDRFDDDDDDLWIPENSEDSMDHEDTGSSVAAPPSAYGDYNARLDEALSNLKISVEAMVKEATWDRARLDTERNAIGSCWGYRGELESAVERVVENLIEREEESRLVVLGLVSKEHVLLLGPPGTGTNAIWVMEQQCGNA